MVGEVNSVSNSPRGTCKRAMVNYVAYLELVDVDPWGELSEFGCEHEGLSEECGEIHN